MTECYFANVELPITFTAGDTVEGEGNCQVGRNKKVFPQEDIGKIQQWLRISAVKEYDTYLQIGPHAGRLWVRLSAQIYLEMDSFEWIGPKLKALCDRVNSGEIDNLPRVALW